jgi:hypothetical protein
MAGDDSTSFEVFIADFDGGQGVGIVLHGASIIEDENGELAPGCQLTPAQATSLAEALLACVVAIEKP